MSDQEAAAAALFAFAAVNFSRKPHVWTEKHKRSSFEDFLKASQLCEAFQHDNMMTSEEERAALTLCSTFFKRMHQTVDGLSGANVLDKDAKRRGDSQFRVHVREIALEVHKLFGGFLYGTVATLVTVGMAPPKSITLKSASNWCADLRVEVPQKLTA